jgi:hypothetical protein
MFGRQVCRRLAFAAIALAAWAAGGGGANCSFAQPIRERSSAGFVHPGLLHTAADLARIKTNVAAGVEPWASAWTHFRGDRLVSLDYRPRPLPTVGRGVDSVGMNNISRDATAAYYHAIAWYISGDEAHAKKSIEILNAWSDVCREINGKDAVLCAGIYGYKIIGGAEIMRHAYKKWPENEVARFERLLRDVLLPVVNDFAPFANGNWDACCLPTMMSIGVFCEDRAIFDRAVRYYYDGPGNGSLANYVINEAGQCQESGRDQPHSQLGLGMLAAACEIGWNQGLDMYGAMNNRLLAGLEYTAKYNLGNDVPFEPYADKTGKYRASRISTDGRGRVMPIWEMVDNHYRNRIGVDTPFTAQMAARRRPEPTTIDQPGAGTLLFTRRSASPDATTTTAAPAIPGGVIAKGNASRIELQWPRVVGAKSYEVKRAPTSDGPWMQIGADLVEPAHVDNDVQPGTTYYYVALAKNDAGMSFGTVPVGATAGLPAPWKGVDLGSVGRMQDERHDGMTFTIRGAGKQRRGNSDDGRFVYASLAGDGQLTARFVPQTPSQFAEMGLMVRTSLDADAACVALVLSPEQTRDIEQPGWRVRLAHRESRGAEARALADSPQIPSPIVTYGRLLKPYWLRLVRLRDRVTAWASADGQTWNEIGAAKLSPGEPLFAGLVVCSRLGEIDTVARFDQVTLQTTGGATK